MRAFVADGLDVALELRRPDDRFSAKGFGVPLEGASEAVAKVLASCFDELEALDEECLRWCFEPGFVAAELAMRAWGRRGMLEQAMHVQAPLRRASFIERGSIAA